MKTFYKVFYYKNIELLAYPVGNEPDEEDEELSSKTELAFDYDISANEIEMKRPDIWDKIGTFLGHLLAATVSICAWLLIIVFTLKLIWFILFRILV